MLHINVQLLFKHQKDMPSLKGPQNFLYMNSCAVTSNRNRLCVTFKPVYCGLFCWFIRDALSLNAFDSILTNIIKVIHVAITKHCINSHKLKVFWVEEYVIKVVLAFSVGCCVPHDSEQSLAALV